nr:hypothetical protein [Ningiella sp. W23]
MARLRGCALVYNRIYARGSDTLKNLLANLECDIAEEPQTYDIPIEEAPEHFLPYMVHVKCNF